MFNVLSNFVSLFVQTQGIMTNITTEKLKKILDEKLNPLSEQLKEALATMKSLNEKTEQFEETFRTLQEDNKALKEEQVSLKARVKFCKRPEVSTKAS